MMGRPKIPVGEAKIFMLRIRMSEADRKLLDDAAGVKGQGISTWAREELVALARRLLAKK